MLLSLLLSHLAALCKIAFVLVLLLLRRFAFHGDLCRSHYLSLVAGQEIGGRSVGTYAKVDHSIQHCPGTYEQTGRGEVGSGFSAAYCG